VSYPRRSTGLDIATAAEHVNLRVQIGMRNEPVDPIRTFFTIYPQ
jgi:hypothetical protein